MTMKIVKYYTCDRCGFETQSPDRLSSQVIVTNSGGEKVYDLCWSCSMRLKNFMNGENEDICSKE